LSGCLAFGEDALAVFGGLGFGDVFDDVDGELAVVVEEVILRQPLAQARGNNSSCSRSHAMKFCAIPTSS
jgi:hypothetical protein